MTFPKAHRWQTLRPGWTRGPRFPTTRLVLAAPSLFTQLPGILCRPPYQVALCSKKLQKPTACQPEAELRGLAFRDLHSLGPFWPPRPLTPPGMLPLLCQSPLRLALAPGTPFGLGGFAHSPPSAWSDRPPFHLPIETHWTSGQGHGLTVRSFFPSDIHSFSPHCASWGGGSTTGGKS